MKGRLFWDSVFLVRPVLMYPVWIFFLAGVWGGRVSAGAGDASGFGVFPVLASLTLVMASVYILNQIQDRETDRANGKLFLLANGIIPLKHAYLEAGLLGAAGLALGFWVCREAGFLLLGLFIAAGILYNYPPPVWKDRPIAGLIANGLGGLFIHAIGWNTSRPGAWIPVESIAYFTACMAVTLNTMLPDMEGDRETGKITFGVRFGVSGTAAASCILETVTVVLAFFLKDRPLFFSSAAVSVFFVLAALRPSVASVVRSTKVSVIAFAAAVCVGFPWFAGLALSVFLGTKLYYKHRFHFDYPNFRCA